MESIRDRPGIFRSEKLGALWGFCGEIGNDLDLVKGNGWSSDIAVDDIKVTAA